METIKNIKTYTKIMFGCTFTFSIYRVNLDEYASFKFTCLTFSLSASSAEVASSSKSTLGFLTRALAMATLCFWPPDNWAPLSPNLVS
jgi:hypothetical protein